jgi:hypothetical protein
VDFLSPKAWQRSAYSVWEVVVSETKAAPSLPRDLLNTATPDAFQHLLLALDQPGGAGEIGDS